MGYVKPQQVDTLTLPSDPSYFVKMKARFDWGDRGKITDALVKFDLGGAAPGAANLSAVEISTGNRAMVLALITEWNLTGEDEKPLPLTLDSIGLLDPEDGDFLLKEALKRTQAAPLVIADSIPPSSQPSTDTPSSTPSTDAGSTTSSSV